MYKLFVHAMIYVMHTAYTCICYTKNVRTQNVREMILPYPACLIHTMITHI